MSDALFAIPVSFATYVFLSQFLTRHKVKREMFEVVDEAVKAWMDSFQAETDLSEASTLNGYQWKHLFLPEGTRLRTIRDGAHLVAHVEGSRLVYEGQICSPSQFVNRVSRELPQCLEDNLGVNAKRNRMEVGKRISRRSRFNSRAKKHE